MGSRGWCSRKALAESLFARWRVFGPDRIVIEATPEADARGLPAASGRNRSGRGERTRTSDLVVPNDARYLLRHAPTVGPQTEAEW